MSEVQKTSYINKSQEKKQDNNKSMSTYNKQKHDDEEYDERTGEKSTKAVVKDAKSNNQ